MQSKKIILIYVIMPLITAAVFIFSIVSGSNDIPLTETVKALFGNANDETLMIINKIRVPRVITAAVTGAGLAASGCVFQGVLKNPLADPFTLGISGGAALGTTIAFVLGLTAASWLFVPFLSFFGALLAVFIVYLLSSRKRFDSNSMILSGVIISYVFSSAVMLLFALSSSHQMQAAFIWLMGNFSTFDERLLPFVFAVIIAGTVILSLSGNIINAISLGGEKSETLGINVESTVKILFLTASFITASAVSICGVIGFVGLMMPHIMRKIVGGNHSLLIPASAFAGAAFLPLCETFSRVLFAPVIIPVGVITSIIGGVFFIFLLMRGKAGVI